MHQKLSRPRSRRYHFASATRLATWGAILGAWAVSTSNGAWADPLPVTIQGVPQQIIPQAAEVGLGDFTLTTGTTTILGGSGSGSSGGSGSGGSGGGGTSSDALDTLLGTSWGSAAAQNASALGVNPSALAATCVIESGCQNVQGTGSITGAFQIANSTYTAAINQALAQDPSLASNIVPGLAGQNDPATQSIAAAEYLRQGAQYLQTQGDANPTVLDVRGYYNFGPQGGTQLFQAPASALVSDTLTTYSASTLAANGITPGETVGEWRSAVSAKLGNAAGAPVLT